MFVWVPQFETEKAKKYCFLIQRSNIYSWNLRAIPTFSFHYPLSIRTGGVGCETIGSIRSESKSSFDFREFLSKFFVEFFRDSTSRFFIEILRHRFQSTPDADENSELLVLFLVLSRITTVLNLFLFFRPFERLWYRMNDVNKSKKNLKFMFGLCFKSLHKI